MQISLTLFLKDSRVNASKLGKRFKTKRMAITANTCYNSHTPISLGVSYVSVPVGILLGVHPTMEVIDRFLPDDCENHYWAFAPIYDGNIHIHLIRSLRTLC